MGEEVRGWRSEVRVLFKFRMFGGERQDGFCGGVESSGWKRFMLERLAKVYLVLDGSVLVGGNY
jgi:hypothetical protein